MPRRLIIGAALAAGMSIAAAIMLATPALAKGPSQASITGPGLVRAIAVTGNGEPGMQGPLATLAGQTGLFTVLFGADAGVTPQTPPLHTPPPKASLGPRYTVIYTVPGVTPPPGQQDGRIRQDLYPDAAGGPVVYTPPGQDGFGGPLAVTGWLRAGPGLTRTLVQLGVPPRPRTQAAPAASPRTAHSAPAHQADSTPVAWLIASAAVIAVAALAGAALRRHHHKPATGHDTAPRARGPAAGSA
jgi:hypothetical protein